MAKYHYTVYVDDNFHYMDESERYKLGEFDDCASAVAACQKLVDEFLLQCVGENNSIEELHKSYTFFGEDPFILTDDPNCKFSARDYAARRVDQMFGRTP
jgi:hypothetical protein